MVYIERKDQLVYCNTAISEDFPYLKYFLYINNLS